MCYEMLNVVLEILDDCCVGVELQRIRRKRAVAAGDVESGPTQEGKFSAMVVVLITSALKLTPKMKRRHT
jgi:hypothetical protein